MKNRIALAFAAAAVTAALFLTFNVLPGVIGTAQATRFEESPQQKTGTGISDSTSFTVYQRTDAERVAGTGPADTTGWLDTRGLQLPDCHFAGQQLIKLTLNVANAAAGDSIGYVIQYSQDQSVIFSKSKAYFTGAGPYNAVLLICDTNANEPSYGYRYYRVIYTDDDQSNTSSWYTATSKLGILRPSQ